MVYFKGISIYSLAPGGWVVKNLPAKKETQVWSPGWEDSLEEDMATHSSVLAWRIPRTEEPGGLHVVTKSQTRLSTLHILCFHCSLVKGLWINKSNDLKKQKLRFSLKMLSRIFMGWWRFPNSLNHLPPIRSQASHSTTLNLSFLFWKMGTIIVHQRVARIIK